MDAWLLGLCTDWLLLGAGTWVRPPTVGVLWTPPYWGWSNGAYAFNQGYWGPHVGFYGGVNYGYGYGGSGYDGGRWNGGNFDYNRSANNFGTVSVQNTYEKTLAVNNRTNVSYVGGENGLKAEPTADERLADSDRHTPATAEQTRHMTIAASDPALAVSHNNGHPAMAATSRPGEFKNAVDARPLPAGAEHAEQPAANEHAAEHAPGPAIAAHPAEHASEPALVAHPAEHASEPAAVAHSAEHAAQPEAVHPAVAHPAERPAEPAAVHPAAARPAQHPAEAVHPAVERAAAPHAAPAHEEKSEEKR